MSSVGTDGLAGNIHGSACVIGTAGILILGEPGSGKSAALARLLADSAADGHFARLVSDDRVIVEPVNGRCLMRAPLSICGLVELRGTGIAAMPNLAKAVLRLAIRIEAHDKGPDRLPAEGETLRVVGHDVPLMRIWPYAANNLYGTAKTFFPALLRSG